MLLIDVVVPVELRQLFVFEIGSWDVTDLALDILQLSFIFPNVASKDSSYEHANEKEEEGDHHGLCDFLDETSWHLSIQNCEAIVFVAMEFDTNDLLHRLE